jgi:hypothetical protein
VVESCNRRIPEDTDDAAGRGRRVDDCAVAVTGDGSSPTLRWWQLGLVGSLSATTEFRGWTTPPAGREWGGVAGLDAGLGRGMVVAMHRHGSAVLWHAPLRQCLAIVACPVRALLFVLVCCGWGQLLEPRCY